MPIYATTSYVFHDTDHAANLFGLREFGNIYTRLMNPTTDVLEKRLAALDGGAAGLAFSSGQAAITAALLTIVHSGQNFISANSLYGGTWTLFTQTLSKLGIEVRFFDPSNPKKWPEFTAPDPSYHGIIFEEALRPIGNIAYIIYIRTHWLRDTGATQSPFGAFLTLLGLETLHLRLERHSKNALIVAQWLEKHPAVEWVNYPGLPSHPDYVSAKKYLPNGQGAIVGFGIKGGKEAGAS